ncbi:uncharacterized protein RHOBADRAFT_52717, partial [Rhodotorula graminis WP1]
EGARVCSVLEPDGQEVRGVRVGVLLLAGVPEGGLVDAQVGLRQGLPHVLAGAALARRGRAPPQTRQDGIGPHQQPVQLALLPQAGQALAPRRQRPASRAPGPRVPYSRAEQDAHPLGPSRQHVPRRVRRGPRRQVRGHALGPRRAHVPRALAQQRRQVWVEQGHGAACRSDPEPVPAPRDAARQTILGQRNARGRSRRRRGARPAAHVILSRGARQERRRGLSWGARARARWPRARRGHGRRPPHPRQVREDPHDAARQAHVLLERAERDREHRQDVVTRGRAT